MQRMTGYLFLSLLAVSAFCSVAGNAAADTVMKVIDGNTAEISPETGGAYYTCRLYGIDAPKPGQAYGKQAADELRKLLLLQTVDVTFKRVKSYTREVCLVKRGGTDIGLEMVRKGYAWAYDLQQKKPAAGSYAAAEKEAREKKRGLWKDKDPQPPWEFRKKK